MKPPPAEVASWEMSPDFEDTIRVLRHCRRALVLVHVAPDGDAIGSALAMRKILSALGKESRISSPDSVPRQFSFLPGSDEIGSRGLAGEDLVVALDNSPLARFGPVGMAVAEADVTILNIDHHITNSRFGNANLVGPEAAATAEILFGLLDPLGVSLEPELATCLLTGLFTDTRGFRTANTSSRALGIAARLAMAGASLPEISREAYESNSLAKLRLWGRILDTAEADGQLVWAANTEAMRAACGASDDDGEGAVNLLATLDRAQWVLLFTERSGGSVEVSMRTRAGHDAADLAREFGGGGHAQAAGFELQGELAEVEAQVLGAARERLEARQEQPVSP